MVKKFDVMFTPAKENRTIHLYLPDDYEETQERYPVVYMFDGHNLFYDEDATYGKSWGMKDFLDNWKKKLIIVGMECAHTGKNTRLIEYCPYHIYMYGWGDISGTGKETMEWIVNELKPMIDREYRTYPFREATAIAGSSMGGMMAFYAALRYNQYFSKAAAVSPTVLPAKTMFTNEVWSNHLSYDTRIFFSWGTEEYTGEHGVEMNDYMQFIDEELHKKKIMTRLMNHQGGRHCEASWEQEIPEWMEFLWY